LSFTNLLLDKDGWGEGGASCKATQQGSSSRKPQLAANDAWEENKFIVIRSNDRLYS